ncbi:MAG: ABC transporter permease [Thermomicrobiales bacterium]|nr:ABC transporter permease [Thermomicrobiales bacterium]
MGRYIAARLASLLFVLLAVSLITFFLMHSVKGGPFDKGERPLPEATRLAMEAKYGLDQPLYRQYITYLGNAIRLDFGVPNRYPNETVMSLIGRTWPITLKLGAATILVAYSLGLFLGYAAAVRQRSAVDYSLTFLATMGIAVPNFVIAIWLILVFGVQLRWFPLYGLDSWRSYVLPVIAYSLGPMALVARYTRSSLVDNLRSDYVRTARAKGLSEQRVMTRHVFRNALIPLITVILPEIPNILTGSIFIEMTFGIPGLGRFFVQSTFNRDYPMIMALVLLVAAFWGLMYLLTDILYVLLDPRVRLVR